MGDRGTSNYSEVTDFILVGFRVHPELHILLFLLFLLVYAMILLGNVGMMVIIMTDPRLNTPMYFFLGNLSFVDLFYSSVIAPKAMINFWSVSKSISFAGCVTQLFLFALLWPRGFSWQSWLMTASLPSATHSSTLSRCQHISVFSWWLAPIFFGCISSVLQTSMTFTLSFCASRTIDHFYCDDRPLQKISCSDLNIHKLLFFSCAALSFCLP